MLHFPTLENYNDESYIATSRKAMNRISQYINLPSFDFMKADSIPDKNELLDTCVRLSYLLNRLVVIESKDKALIALCAAVSSYANRVEQSLQWYYNIIVPRYIQYRSLELRIEWYAQLRKSEIK
ncbi:hypothetical protein FP371_24590 [Citrobacter freundii]|nr:MULTISPECIES: hypothetical protein [Enterobacteriaceae]EEA2350444.1 hypothetical protein [Salmonella enterica subsp. enterica serovar Enteritidis]EEC4304222.1 hypothetical protein [Salmonella enterica subsp. enterica serovar Enteritidis]EEN2406646.1 hypothetical protein [Salmonella enterica subsp. enterica serovar Enteritidis]EES8921262.1 hypothetical protein [Escherichia coli]EES9862670.1 hypothetical protein [Escherichia coli]